MALGAEKGRISGMVIAQGMKVADRFGLAIGIGGAFGLTRYLCSQLSE